MNILNRIYRSLLLTFLVGSIAQISATENKVDENSSHDAAEQVQQEQAIRQFLDDCLKQELNQVNDLDILLEELQLIVGNNGVQVVNKRDMLESIKYIRLLVQQINITAHAYTHPQELQLLNAIIESTIEHVAQALGKGFKQLEPLDLEASITRGSRLPHSPEQLNNQIQKNAASLIQLKEKAKNVGLTRFNKAYRTFDSYVVQPGNKYNFLAPAFPYIGKNSEIALSSAALLSLLAYKFSYLNHTAEDLEKESSNYIKNPNYGQEAQEGKNVTDELLKNEHYGKSYPTKPQHENSKRESITVNFDKVNDKDTGVPVSITTTFYKKYLNFLRHTIGLGYPIRNNRYGAIDHSGYHSDHPIGHIGNIENLFFGTPSLFLWLCTRTATPSWSIWKDFCAWSDKKTKKMASEWKGGAYANQPVEPGNTSIPKTTLDDLIGLDEVKEVFTEIVAYFKNPETFDRSKLTPERGFLLTGPPRTGKTFSAECLAGEIRAMYAQTGRNPDEFSYHDLNASFIKQAGIGNLFSEAKYAGPCIIFIDEIDLLCLQRVGGNSTELSECLTGLCKCLQTNPSKPVVIIAATNRPQNIDAALAQRGRFGKELRFEYPNMQNRYDFLTKKLNELAADSRQFNIEKLVHETENCSYEDITALIRGAFLNAKLHRQTLTQQYIDTALDKEIRHILFNNNHVLPEQESHLLAAHIAGKALTLELLSNDEQIAKATILPYMPKLMEETTWDTMYQAKENEQKKIEYGQVFSYHLQDTRNITNRAKDIERIKRLVAGFIAEEVLLGVPSGYTYNIKDAQSAQKLAEKVVSESLDIQKLPEELKVTYIKEALKLKDQCKKQVLALLTEYRPALEALKNALLEHKILTGAQVKQIIAQAMPTKPAVVK